MPEISYAEVKRNLALKFAEHGMVLPGRKLKAVAAIFTERSRFALIDLDRFVLDYQDPTGETAVRNVLEGAA